MRIPLTWGSLQHHFRYVFYGPNMKPNPKTLFWCAQGLDQVRLARNSWPLGPGLAGSLPAPGFRKGPGICEHGSTGVKLSITKAC